MEIKTQEEKKALADKTDGLCVICREAAAVVRQICPVCINREMLEASGQKNLNA